MMAIVQWLLILGFISKISLHTYPEQNGTHNTKYDDSVYRASNREVSRNNHL